MKKIILSLYFLVMTDNLKAYELGNVIIKGQGCDSKDNPVQMEILNATQGSEVKRFEFPVQISLEKKKSKLSERKACTVRLPLNVQSNEKLQIKNIRQDIELSLDSKSGVTIDLEVSDINLNFELQNGSSRKTASMSSGTQSISTKCGVDYILELNSSIRGTGVGEGKIMTKGVLVEIISEKCK
jgi:hypothetical protein